LSGFAPPGCRAAGSGLRGRQAAKPARAERHPTAGGSLAAQPGPAYPGRRGAYAGRCGLLAGVNDRAVPRYIQVYTWSMTPRKKVPYFTKLDPELREALRRYKAAVGVPEAEQIDRALREWLGERADAWPVPKLKGDQKTGRKRAVTRKRP
jgi:hypothetical protein